MVEARLFQALSDPTRLRILTLLAHEPINVSGMVERLGCAQPAVSRHLRVLRDVALIQDRRMGKEVEYSLNHDQLAEAAGYLECLLTNDRVGTLRSPALTPAQPAGTEGATRKAAPPQEAGPRAVAQEPEGVKAAEVGVLTAPEARGRRPAERVNVGRGPVRARSTTGATRAVAGTEPPAESRPQQGGTEAGSATARPRKAKGERGKARGKPQRAEAGRAPAKVKPRRAAARGAAAGRKSRKGATELPPEPEPAFVIERDADSMDDFLL
jgi:ArsR family transcriptional regulator